MDVWSTRVALGLGLALLLSATGSRARAEVVEFTLRDPSAKQVYLAGEMTEWDQGKRPMRRSADGVWRVSLDLADGQWVYKYVVDGKWIADPVGTDNDNDGQGGRHSFLFVGDHGSWRGDPAVAHGRVETALVPSAAWGKPMKVNVYLPPGFDKSRRYPVLVLLHGAGMDADQWYRTGHIERYMDNLIAERAITPFVVLMPSSEDVYYLGKSERHITEELPPWLAERYGQTLDARHAATAGMSMGGFGAVVLPLHHPMLFGLGYALSSYFPPEQVQAMTVPSPLPFRLVMFTGDKDRVSASAPLFNRKLDEAGVQYAFTRDSGAHTWNYFSRHTSDLLTTAGRYFSP